MRASPWPGCFAEPVTPLTPQGSIAAPATPLVQGYKAVRAKNRPWPDYMYKTARELAYEDICTSHSDGEKDNNEEEEDCVSCGSAICSD